MPRPEGGTDGFVAALDSDWNMLWKARKFEVSFGSIEKTEVDAAYQTPGLSGSSRSARVEPAVI